MQVELLLIWGIGFACHISARRSPSSHLHLNMAYCLGTGAEGGNWLPQSHEIGSARTYDRRTCWMKLVYWLEASDILGDVAVLQMVVSGDLEFSHSVISVIS